MFDGQIEVRLGRAFKRKYKVKGLMDKGAGELVFYNEQQGEDMTVADYYAERYNVRYTQLTLQCIFIHYLHAWMRLFCEF